MVYYSGARIEAHTVRINPATLLVDSAHTGALVFLSTNHVTTWVKVRCSNT